VLLPLKFFSCIFNLANRLRPLHTAGTGEDTKGHHHGSMIEGVAGVVGITVIVIGDFDKGGHFFLTQGLFLGFFLLVVGQQKGVC
jgi:hypothetical protein